MAKDSNPIEQFLISMLWVTTGTQSVLVTMAALAPGLTGIIGRAVAVVVPVLKGVMQVLLPAVGVVMGLNRPLTAQAAGLEAVVGVVGAPPLVTAV